MNDPEVQCKHLNSLPQLDFCHFSALSILQYKLQTVLFIILQTTDSLFITVQTTDTCCPGDMEVKGQTIVSVLKCSAW